MCTCGWQLRCFFLHKDLFSPLFSVGLWGFLLDITLIIQNIKIFLILQQYIYVYIHINIDVGSWLESRSIQIDSSNTFSMSGLVICGNSPWWQKGCLLSPCHILLVGKGLCSQKLRTAFICRELTLPVRFKENTDWIPIDSSSCAFRHLMQLQGLSRPSVSSVFTVTHLTDVFLWVSVCVYTYVHTHMSVEIRGQLVDVGSLLPPWILRIKVNLSDLVTEPVP